MNVIHQRIGTALDLLSVGIYPYFERELQAVYGDRWEVTARQSCRSQATLESGEFHWDAQAILTVMWDLWNPVFRKNLGIVERSIVSELRDFRNRWAHQAVFTDDDGYRVLDSIQRLLIATHSTALISAVEEQKLDLLREKLGRRVNEEMARARFNRKRIIDIGLYALCATAIAAMIMFAWGERHPMPAGLVVGFTLFVFAYLIYGRFQLTPPAYGVHECGKCGKVVYSEICPYCDPTSRTALPNNRLARPDRSKPVKRRTAPTEMEAAVKVETA